MIKANELRIGNWVLIHGAAAKVESIMSDEINLEWRGIFDDDIDVHGTDIETVNPIPLTPEILEKCGFESRHPDSEKIFSWIKAGVILNCYKDDTTSYWLYPGLQTHKIQYLHQLQNLYYALTGTELNVNL